MINSYLNTPMDDLCIKMIANTRKLKVPSEDASLNDSHYRNKVIQILHDKYFENSILVSNMKDFCQFLEEYEKTIMVMFEKTLQGKQK